MARTSGTLDNRRLALLDRFTQHVRAAGGIPDEVRRAVDLLTAAADPDRADGLAVAPHDPPVVVERLAVWALQRATDVAVAAADRLLDRHEGDQTVADDPGREPASGVSASSRLLEPQRQQAPRSAEATQVA